MDTDMVVVAVIAAGGGILGGAGVAEVVKGLFGRKPRNVVAVDNEVKLAQQAAAQAASSAAYAAQMQESARQAWAQAATAERRAAEHDRAAQERVNAMERTVDELEERLSLASRYVVWFLRLLEEPDMTIEGMRSNVRRNRPPVGVNGQGGQQ